MVKIKKIIIEESKTLTQQFIKGQWRTLKGDLRKVETDQNEIAFLVLEKWKQ